MSFQMYMLGSECKNSLTKVTHTSRMLCLLASFVVLAKLVMEIIYHYRTKFAFVQ